MRYISVCSGIEAATVAWHHMGWTPTWFSEIEPFPSAVLAHHYPAVKNLGDMTKYEEWPDESVELLVGGTPCQAFSVAGLRQGLADPRGGLMLTYLEIARRYRPRWVVWENVPGVLSSGGGRDFGAFLGALGELGYGFAYRVLDAQWFGVAQRRRRVFVVGYLGSWERAAAVLFERESVRRDTPPSRETREGVAPVAESGFDERGLQRTVGTLCADTHPGAYSGQDAYTGRLVPHPVAMQPVGVPEVMSTLLSSTAGISRPGNAVTEHETYIPMAPAAIGFNWQNAGGYGNANEGLGITAEGIGPLQRCQTPAVATALQVRRLTPTECERLQGFPDCYTNIPWRKKPEAPDGPRYKALGNSMAVPVMRWIGERIRKVDNEQ